MTKRIFTGACVHSVASYRHLREVRFRQDDDGSFVLEVGDARVTLGADVAHALYCHLDDHFGSPVVIPEDPQGYADDNRGRTDAESRTEKDQENDVGGVA